jgi:hypothetical protein
MQCNLLLAVFYVGLVSPGCAVVLDCVVAVLGIGVCAVVMIGL